MSAARLTILARGWEHPAWSDWYPEDLPSEWRLGYYSSSCHDVLVPAFQLAATPVPADWLADVHERFRFWLELDDGLHRHFDGDAQRFRRHLGDLVPQVAGFVDRGLPETALDWHALLADWRLPVCDGRRPWRPGAVNRADACLGLIETAPGDNRELGRWLREFIGMDPGHGDRLFCFEGYPGSWRHLHDTLVMAELF